MSGDWEIYKNDNEPRADDGAWEVPAPSWRQFDSLPTDDLFVGPAPGDFAGPFFYRADQKVKDTVNLALHLRRPILVTGAPGTGKTSLASSIAYELGLGPVLQWLITSKSTVRDGIYQYDVLARVNDMNLADKEALSEIDPEYADALKETARNIGEYITLGPLGDALLPRPKPRVLLIDEIDKSDIDLPGDLLHVLERGSFEIPELVRERDQEVTVRCAPREKVRGQNQQYSEADTEDRNKVRIYRGQVTCSQFPVIVLTSNEDRDFPTAFRRRCLPLQLDPPTPEALWEIAKEKLGKTPGKAGETLIDRFVREPADPQVGRGKDGRLRATDQLLNALYLRMSGSGLNKNDVDRLYEIVLARLGESFGD
jgi:MoxR-like ATPase